MQTFIGYISEATLVGKSTNGTPNIKKYVIDNPKALTIDYSIENKKKDVPVYDQNGIQTSVTQAGTTFRLLSKKVYDIDGNQALHTSIGYIHIKHVRKPSGFKAMDAEILATSDLDGYIRKAVMANGNKGISVKIGKFTVADVVTASSDHIKGDPKADIALINSSGKEVGFISHKKEGGAKGFSQYGGISIKSGLKHKEIEAFVNDLAAVYKTDKPKSGDAYYRVIKDPRLINASVYGPGYGGAFARDNCHCIGQGNPLLIGKKGKYTLDFSESIHINGDVKWAKIGKFTAVFGATFRSGRKVMSPKGVEVKNIRAGIYPVAYMNTRRKLKEI